MNKPTKPTLPIDYRHASKNFTPCDCCGCTESHVAFSGDRHKFGLKTVVCKMCGLIFTNPRPSAEWFEEFYSRHYRQFYEAIEIPDAAYLEKDWITGRHRRNVAFLENYLPQTGRLLDIGCAEGAFLNEFQNKFKAWEVEGLEPSIHFSRFAREHYSLPNIRTGFIKELKDFPAARYDLVTLNHVLEHVMEPSALLQTIHLILKPGGKLFVDVPDAEGGAPGLGRVHIAHVYHFSAWSLRNLHAKTGFRVLALEKGKEQPDPWTIHLAAEKAPAGAAWTKPSRVDYQTIAREFSSRCSTPLPAKLKRSLGKFRKLIVGRTLFMDRHGQKS